jgi:hypothetical protein
MAAYQLIRDPRTGETVGVLRASDGASIPKDPDNREWKEFQAWRQAGGNPDPAAVDPDEKLTARRLARALIRKGVITRAEIEAELE